MIKDLLLILCVLLVLLILISIFGGSIQYPTDKFEEDSDAAAAYPVMEDQDTLPPPLREVEVEKFDSSTLETAAKGTADGVKKIAGLVGTTAQNMLMPPSIKSLKMPAVEAFQGDEFALVP